MPIEISGNIPPHIQNTKESGVAQTQTVATPDANDTRPTAAGDSVTLTPTAEQLQRLERQISTLPVIDVQRVESVQQAVNNGTYTIDPARVADKLYGMEMALNRSRG